MMVSESKSQKSQASGKDKGRPDDSGAELQDVLRPFQEAAERFLRARRETHEAALQQQAQACFDMHRRAWEVGKDAQDSLFEVAKDHFSEAGLSGNGDEDQGLARARTQLEYEHKARQIEFDAQMKLKSVADSALADQGNQVAQEYVRQQQEAYGTYLADLQKAWSGAKSLDPQTASAIASNIMFTINAAG